METPAQAADPHTVGVGQPVVLEDEAGWLIQSNGAVIDHSPRIGLIEHGVHNRESNAVSMRLTPLPFAMMCARDRVTGCVVEIVTAGMAVLLDW